VHGSTVLYPSDATSTAHLVAAMANRQGVVYLRATRGPCPVLYDADETFPIGGSKVLRSSPHDQVTLVGAGVTLHSCVAAGDLLAAEGIKSRIIDAYSVKPIDGETLRDAAVASSGRVVVAEDHHPEGGLGEAVLASLTSTRTPVRLEHLAVRLMPGSGSPHELLHQAGLSASHVAAAARRLLNATDHAR
jgi:transketolase